MQTEEELIAPLCRKALYLKSGEKVQVIAVWPAQLGEVRESLLQMQNVDHFGQETDRCDIRVGLLPI